MKAGDLVRRAPDIHGDEDAIGVIITWVRTGGTETTLWEVLWAGTEIEIWEETDLELLNERR